jgi:glycosyltransferase involved in cell wall biosynthesis
MAASFITWYPYCRRSDTIAQAIGAPSHLIHYFSFKRPLYAPVKYPLQAAATARVLWHERPDAVLVAVPPIFAVFPAWIYHRRHGARIVIDAHTGIFDHERWRWLLPLTRAVFRRADAVIVTSEELRARVAAWGARGIVIGDVPVTFVPGSRPSPCDGPRVVVVNSFSVDEPLDAIMDAARLVGDARFFVTGDTRHATIAHLNGRPSNLTFTGFLSEEGYAGLLRAADVVVVLTTHDLTMQRGAYEAVALGRPLVTSDWPILRETFSRGTLHVQNTAEAIARGIRVALDRRDFLAEEMLRLRQERRAIFTARLQALRQVLELPSTNGAAHG